MIINKNTKKIVVVIFMVMILIWIGVYLLDDKSPFSRKAGDMVNIVDLVNSIDKNNFHNYQVKEKQEKSKELIAVVFNTDSKYNLGFIDEYGNVIKEPFLQNPYYNFENRTDGEIGVKRYYNGYFYDVYTQSYYDENFNKVNILPKNLQEFEKENIQKENYEKVSTSDFNKVKNVLKDILKNGYEISNYNVSKYNGGYYVSFINQSGTSYYFC